MTVFIDSNIPMYAAGREHPLKTPALRLLASVRDGDIEACTSTEVLQEILYRYSGLDRLDLGFEIYSLFVSTCPVVLPVTLADTDRARDLLAAHSGISVRDTIHAAVMINHGIGTIATFDRGFDRVPGIERLALA